MKYIVKDQVGFTLIELLIALVIFAVGILGVASMQITSIQGNSKGRQISEASTVAASQLERFIASDYSNLEDGHGTNNGVAGLDDLSPSDGAMDTDGDGVSDIFWNVAENYPIFMTKTIRVIVDPIGNGSNVSMDIVKNGPIN